jgi:hypothetical protein
MDEFGQIASANDQDVMVRFGLDGGEDIPVDLPSYARVMAFELIRARHRMNLYRTLYGSFLGGGTRFMIENLDEDDEHLEAVPAKLVFTDDPEQALALEAEGDVNIWSELELLEALNHAASIQQYFADVLDELAPAIEE